jgi:uncharacterized protein YhfF
MTSVVDGLRQRTGLPVVGAFAFGDSPELADELLDFVHSGTKRATAGAATDAHASDRPTPEPGQYWGLLDGRGEPAFVMETVEVTRGRMGDVTPAFAWDEGEYDRTLESWLDAHRRFFRRQGVRHPDDLDVLFERFRVVWPEPDTITWLTDDVRPLRWDEREWQRTVHVQRWSTTRMVTRGRMHDVTQLPGLVCERDGRRIGLLTFRPRPGGVTECVSVDAFEHGAGVGAALTAGITEVGRRHRWRRLWLVTSNDNTPALRAYQRGGWDLVALRHGSIDAARRVKPEIPATGRDGIPLRSELELEIRLDPQADETSPPLTS